MYSRFQLAKKFLHYYLHASNGKGHGVHSPFVFDFIKHVLNDKKEYSIYQVVEEKRKALLQDNTIITVEDFGAGSGMMRTKERRVRQIAATSLKSKKYAQLLYRIANYYHPETIVELGTSLGITTSYLSAAAKVYTLEGSSAIAAIAQKNFNDLGLHAELITGPFEEKLPLVLARIPAPGLAFVDGNHRKAPTMAYFKQLLKKSTDSTILVFDDIHWSEEMEAAWADIKAHPEVTLTIDLFFIGIVLMRKDFKVKQHFLVRF